MTTRYKSESNIIDDLKRRVEDVSKLQQRSRSQDAFFPEPWREIGVELGLQNGWGNFGGSYTIAAFRKELGGVVRLKGFIAGGTIGSPFATLPLGYRPAEITPISVHCNGAAGRLDIWPNGDMTIAVGNNTHVTLNGITWVIA
jgi:hypothetical protein